MQRISIAPNALILHE